MQEKPSGSPFCADQLLLMSMRPILECGCCTHCHSFEENVFSLFQRLSVANSLLVTGKTLCLLILLGVGFLSGLNLCRSCVCVTSSVRSCVSALLCVENTVSLESSTTSGSYNLFPHWFLVPHRSLSLEGRVMIKTSSLGLSTLKFLTLYTISGCGSLC